MTDPGMNEAGTSRPILSTTMIQMLKKTLDATTSSGQQLRIDIDIGLPQQNDTNWSCTVKVGGLWNRTVSLVGIDAWQALQLAQQFAADQLKGFVDTGGQLRHPDSDQAIAPSELFVA